MTGDDLCACMRASVYLYMRTHFHFHRPHAFVSISFSFFFLSLYIGTGIYSLVCSLARSLTYSCCVYPSVCMCMCVRVRVFERLLYFSAWQQWDEKWMKSGMCVHTPHRIRIGTTILYTIPNPNEFCSRGACKSKTINTPTVVISTYFFSRLRV